MNYTCHYRQLFNVFGAPGIPNTYEAVLLHGESEVERLETCFRRRAERQCETWARLYGAKIEHASQRRQK